jgi:hypothetical protein
MRKLPDNITREDLIQFSGTQGTKLNPVLDADGDLVVSEEEWNSPEFAYLKKEYPDFAAAFTFKEFKPILNPPPY